MIAADLAPLARPIDSLSTMPGNPRRGDVDAVARSLDRFGQRKPVVAKRDGTVIAGNHTLAAARRLGWSELAVVFTDDDDEIAKAYALADNRTSAVGRVDDVDLAAMLATVAASDDESLLAATSYDASAVAALLAAPEFAEADTTGTLDVMAQVTCPSCGHKFPR